MYISIMLIVMVIITTISCPAAGFATMPKSSSPSGPETATLVRDYYKSIAQKYYLSITQIITLQKYYESIAQKYCTKVLHKKYYLSSGDKSIAHQKSAPLKLPWILSCIFQRIVAFPVDFQQKFPKDFQRHFPMEFHLCDFWCVIFCPETQKYQFVFQRPIVVKSTQRNNIN